MQIHVTFYHKGRGINKRSICLPETTGPIKIRDILPDILKNGEKELVEAISTLRHDGPRKNILIALNGRNIRSLQGMDTYLNDGDCLAVLPVVAGG